ncbi:glutathione S-transferase family protein [Planktotalea sp.]|uniref:glutathione S-transferase family protein n=1 Tax=Planktotalea sp. TaxID=2029877 RepID=UPI003296A6C9
MTLTLYHSAYSTCSQKVRLTLAEKGLEYTSNELSFAKQEQLEPDYLKINPNGVVPTLVDGDDVIMDSSVIVEYLEEAYPTPALSPSDTVERAKMRVWLRFMEEVPTKAVRIPSFQRVFLPTLRLVKRRSGFAKDTDQRTLRKGFYGKMNKGQGFSDPEIEESNHHLRMTVERIEKALVIGPWVLGGQLTLVDLTLAPLIDRMLDMGCLEFFEDAPKTLEWMARLQARPSYDQAFYKGARLSDRTEFQYAKLRNWIGGIVSKSA